MLMMRFRTVCAQSAPLAPPLIDRVRRFYLPALVALVTGLAYGGRLALYPYWGDGLELTAAGRTLGVAHPTGYPLFTLMIHVAQRIPLGTVGFRSNLMDAALGVTATFLWYHIFCHLLGRLRGQPWVPRGLWKEGYAAACALAIGGSRSFWIHSVIVEVYVLSMVLTALAILCALRLLDRFCWRAYGCVCLTLGLALANHRLAGAAVPFVLLCLARPWASAVASGVRWRGLTSPFLRMAVVALALGGAGLAAYAYLPIRAAVDPPMNWGNPDSVERFLWSVRGGQFAETKMFQAGPGAPFTPELYRAWIARRGIHVAGWMMDQVGWTRHRLPEARVSGQVLLLVLALLGAWVWLRADPWVALAAGGFVGLNTLAVFLYNIPDIGGYLMPLWPWVVFAALLGFCRMAWWAQSRWLRQELPWRHGVVVAVPLLMVLVNRADLAYLKTDASFRYGRTLLETTAPESIILTGGDSDIYALWYQQVVERYRTDVTVFGVNFIGASTWYKTYFQGRHAYARQFPFLETMVRDAPQLADLCVDGIIDPQMAAGRAIYATTNSPAIHPFVDRYTLRPTGPLLRDDDYDTPEGAPVIDVIGAMQVGEGPGARFAPVTYGEVAEGGILPLSPVAFRLFPKIPAPQKTLRPELEGDGAATAGEQRRLRWGILFPAVLSLW